MFPSLSAAAVVVACESKGYFVVAGHWGGDHVLRPHCLLGCCCRRVYVDRFRSKGAISKAFSGHFSGSDAAAKRSADTSVGPSPESCRAGYCREGKSRTPSMYADEKSDEAIVPWKRSNNGRQLPAEVVEGRASPKGNSRQAAVVRTLSRVTTSFRLAAVRRIARGLKPRAD